MPALKSGMHCMVDVVDGGARLNVDCDSEEDYMLTAAWLTMAEERSAEVVMVVKVKEIRTTAKYLAQAYTTSKSNRIIITNDKGRLSKEKIDHMVEEAEKSRESSLPP
ncbi:hypothetical protein C8R45DRAFT_930008 [Mycena sanguinolenta]|nr:hypothetical protein C8R45DRAFT_930008 [Mycena sanguinolenta]